MNPTLAAIIKTIKTTVFPHVGLVDNTVFIVPFVDCVSIYVTVTDAMIVVDHWTAKTTIDLNDPNSLRQLTALLRDTIENQLGKPFVACIKDYKHLPKTQARMTK